MHIIKVVREPYIPCITDVYPYLRTVCGRLGIEFGTVDMRWGVTEEATMDHSTVDMCVNEIQRSYIHNFTINLFHSCSSNCPVKLYTCML